MHITMNIDIFKNALKIMQCKCEYIFDDKKGDIKIKYNDIHITIKLEYEKIKCNEHDYISAHFVRLVTNNKLNILHDESFVINLLEFIDNIIDDIFGYCTLCGTKIINMNKIEECNGCYDKSMEIPINDCVVKCYKNDSAVFNILVLTGIACLCHPKKDVAFKPFPSNFGTMDNLVKKVTYNIKNFGELIKILENCDTDIELLAKIGKENYSFLKFVIKTNITNLRSGILFDEQNTFGKQIANNILETKEIITFMVSHSPIVEKAFAENKPTFAFHGSSLSSWYGILRNGIKNCSHTSLMSSGAAYGSGIYLGKSLNTSFNYSADRYAGSNMYAVGVVQLLNSKDYERSAFGGIYVVPNEKDVLLKYLIITKTNEHISKINEYFTQKRALEIQLSSTNINYIRNKRLLVESEKMTKICEKNKWNFEENNEQWKIEFCGNVLNVKFSTDYPSSPPFMWFSKARKMKNISTLDNGAVFIEDISPAKWNAGKKVYQFIKNMLTNIETVDVNGEFSDYDEAKSYEEYWNKITKMNLV